MASTPLNLGFLMVQQESSGYLGGYMVTNAWGRPLEFRLSSAVQPNKVQQLLYGGTLVPYICGDVIGKALVEKAAVPVGLVVTNCEAALDLRLKLDIPVAWLLPPDEPISSNPLVVKLPKDRGRLLCHQRHPQDVEAIQKALGELDGSIDLTEPFERVRMGVAEARKMGVGNRPAA